MNIGVVFDDRLRPDTTGHYFARALGRLGNNIEHFLPENLEKARGKDLIFKMDDGISNETWDNTIHPSAYYVIDTHIETDWRLKLAESFDYIFVCHKEGLDLPFLKKPVWIPVGCEPETHMGYPCEKKYDICFLGNFHSQFAGKRIDMLDAALSAADTIFVGHRPPKETAGVFAQSRIVFNCAMNGDVNMRFFEALCSGSALLTDRIPLIGELGFKEDTHYFAYADRQEATEKVKFLLANPDIRQRAAAQGQIEVLHNHTYLHRAKTMLENLTREPVCP